MQDSLKGFNGDTISTTLCEKKFLEKSGYCNIKTPSNYIKNLETKGFLKAITVGKEKLCLNFRLMEILKSDT